MVALIVLAVSLIILVACTLWAGTKVMRLVALKGGDE